MRRLALVFILAFTAGSQDTFDGMTVGLLNGRWWKRASLPVKAAFVAGYTAHRTSYPRCIDPPEDVWLKVPVEYGEVVESIDDFYREPANAAIPFFGAFKVVVLKFNGASAAEQASETESLRKAVVDVSEKARPRF